MELRKQSVKVTCLQTGDSRTLTLDGVTWAPLSDPEILASYELVVADGYNLGDAIHRSLAQAKHLAWMHVPRSGAPTGDVVLDVPGSGDMAGLQYACLRPAFRNPPPHDIRADVSKVLVTTGASDLAMPPGRLAALVREDSEVEIRCVLGPYSGSELPAGVAPVVAPKSLFNELTSCDVVICAAGQTLFEAMATGTPAIAIVLAENQRRQACLARNAGGAIVIEEMAELEEAISTVQDRGIRKQLSSMAQRAVDGRGAERVALRMLQLLREAPAQAYPSQLTS